MIRSNQPRPAWTLLAALCVLGLSLPAHAVDVSAVGALTPFNPANAVDLATFCNGTDTGDDTNCIGAWLAAGKARGVHLTASPGTYRYRAGKAIFQGFHLQCKSTAAVFQAIDNAGNLFVLAPNWLAEGPTAWQDISIENCGFDLNGSTANFASVITLIGGTRPVRHVTIRGNRIFDATQPGRMYTASNRQRQYIGVLHAEQVLIEDNALSEGGRIKAGRPGRWLHIRRNVLSNINDNGITVVDLGSNTSHDILIEDNAIFFPIGSGIFFGADGQAQGTAAMTLHDVTVRGNTVFGTWKNNGITGVFPNHTANVYVFNNRVHHTGSANPLAYIAGIGLNRNNTATLIVPDLTSETNDVYSDALNAYRNLAGIFVTGGMTAPCVTANVVTNTATSVFASNTPTPIFLRNLVRETVLEDNTLYSGTVRLGPTSTVDQEGNPTTCFRDG
jgi:hypothetical protein